MSRRKPCASHAQKLCNNAEDPIWDTQFMYKKFKERCLAKIQDRKFRTKNSGPKVEGIQAIHPALHVAPA